MPENMLTSPTADDLGFDLAAPLRTLARHGLALAAATLVGGGIGWGVSHLFAPTFVSSTTFLPPQPQGAAPSALSTLGALSGLVGGPSVRNSADQYVALLQSTTVSDRILKAFDLQREYDVRYLEDARKVLAKRVQIGAGKKDGLIRVDVEDTDPQRAAAMANRYVDELRTVTARLAITEAQQRRVFFEQRLTETKARLVAAQTALGSSALSPGALKAEPRTAAEGYAKLRADLTVAQVRLQVLRGSMAESAAEVQQQLATVRALAQQVSAVESTGSQERDSADYVGRYREFKYQETLFDLFARQLELARVDESREGSLIQVVDPGQPAEKRHWPRRSLFAAGGAALAFALAAATLLWRHRASRTPPSLPSTP